MPPKKTPQQKEAERNAAAFAAAIRADKVKQRKLEAALKKSAKEEKLSSQQASAPRTSSQEAAEASAPRTSSRKAAAAEAVKSIDLLIKEIEDADTSVMEKIKPNTFTFDKIFQQFNTIDGYYYGQIPPYQIPPYQIPPEYTRKSYLVFLKDFQLRVNVEKQKLANRFNLIYHTLNKCMTMILNADKLIKPNGYSHFKRNGWCFFSVIKDNLFNEKDEFILDRSLTINGVTTKEFNLEHLIKNDDILYFFILFHKIKDMYNVLMMLSNILRTNNKQCFLYDWSPDSKIFTFITSIENLHDNNLRGIQHPIKKFHELTINNAMILINQIPKMEEFFYTYAAWMQYSKGMENNIGRQRGAFIPKLFKPNNEKIRHFFYYLTGKNIDEICQDDKYKIPILPEHSNNLVKQRSQKKLVETSANGASANANGASANGFIKVAGENLSVGIGSNNGTKKKSTMRAANGASANRASANRADANGASANIVYASTINLDAQEKALQSFRALAEILKKAPAPSSSWYNNNVPENAKS